MNEWLSERLGVPIVREDDRGRLSGNSAAQPLVEAHRAQDLHALLSALCEPSARPELEHAIDAARSGAATELVLQNGGALFLVPERPGRAMIVLPTAHTAVPTLSGDDLARGVYHELANALAAIAGWARLARKSGRVDEALALIQGSAESAWSAARRLLDDVHGARPNTFESVDFSAFVDEAARLLRPTALAKRVQVRVAIDPGIHVPCTRGSAWSIVWNLALNAVEALAPEGTLELRVSARGENVLFSVSDDGPGMTPAQAQRAFEPYFTTKPNGTGLGLPLVRRAVAELGGRIELDSAPAAGTRFDVTLPRILRDADGAEDASSGMPSASIASPRILVVEDDLGLREMIATALSMRGAEVTAVSGSEAALAQRQPFALAIIDLVLPDTRGDTLLSRLRDAHVVERALIMTGTELPDEVAVRGMPDDVLRKPFELEELFEAVARLTTPSPRHL